MRSLRSDTGEYHLVMTKDEARMIRDLNCLIDEDWLIKEARMDPQYAAKFDEMLRQADWCLNEIGVYYKGYPMVEAGNGSGEDA